MPSLGFGVASAETRPVVPNRLVNEVLVHLRAKDRIVQVDRADYLISKIKNVNCRHDYRFALRTRT